MRWIGNRPFKDAIDEVIGNDPRKKFWYDAPGVGEVEIQSSGWSWEEDRLSDIYQDLDHVNYVRIWLRSGSFYTGNFCQNEPDIIFANYVDVDLVQSELVFVHDNAKYHTNGFSMQNFIMETKLSSMGDLPKDFVDLPVHLLALDQIYNEVAILYQQLGLVGTGYSTDDFSGLPILKQHCVLNEKQKAENMRTLG